MADEGLNSHLPGQSPQPGPGLLPAGDESSGSVGNRSFVSVVRLGSRRLRRAARVPPGSVGGSAGLRRRACRVPSATRPGIGGVPVAGTVSAGLERGVLGIVLPTPRDQISGLARETVSD